MAKGVNFIQNIFSSFLGGVDPEAAKKRGLKNIAKNLSRARYHFYKHSTNQAEPSMGKFFYDIYKAVAPAQLMFLNTTPNILKKMVLTTVLTEQQQEALERLGEESILSQSRETSCKELEQKVRGELNAFVQQFDAAKIKQTDALYSKLVAFSTFCTFDFYFLLKKFIPGLKERSFTTMPKFQPISATYITEDLKNFVAIAWALPLEKDWDDLFALLKRVKGVEPITLSTWKKVLLPLRSVRDQHIFEMIIQLSTENLAYRETVKAEELHIMDEYLQEIHKQVDATLEKLAAEEAAGKIGGILEQVFDTTTIDSLRYYNSDNSAVYERKGLAGFLYCDPLRYLKHFLLDFTKRDMRELSDILLVRGSWATQSLAAPMSEAYHQLLEISAQITQLDEKVAESGEYGLKLKTLLPRADRDKEARNIMSTVLSDINNDAGELILLAAKNYVIFDRNLKMALEDFMKAPRSELIVNWKELDHFAEGMLKEKCVNVYKKVYLFVSLLQNYQIKVRSSDD